FRAYKDAARLNPSVVSANDWNNVCWKGSLEGFAKAVIAACENALNKEPDNLGYRDSRGLARALIGDRKGAIADFEAFLQADRFDEYKEQRRGWIKMLKAGQNPFTPEVLKSIQNQ